MPQAQIIDLADAIVEQLNGHSFSQSFEAQRGYLDEYFGSKEMSVYWGTAREFAAELRRRWEAYHD